MAEIKSPLPKSEVSTRLLDPLEACANGDLAPNVALMRLMIDAQSPSEIDELLKAIDGAGSLGNLKALWSQTANAWETVKFVLDNVNHGSSRSDSRDPEYWADRFDELAESAPEAGIALYSLGSPILLELATVSLVDRLQSWGLLHPSSVVLDLGCGMGRVCEALASRVRAVVGIDVSRRMLALARRRCINCRNVFFVQTSGRDLAAFADASFDLVLAVDTFPYLVLSSPALAATHLSEARRVLKPGGSLVAFNYAYGVDDRTAAEMFCQHAKAAALEPVRLGTRDLAWWDGVTYHVRRASRELTPL